MTTPTDALLRAAQELNRALAPLQFSHPVAYTYNPLEYAWNGYEAYIKRYVGKQPCDVLYLGMNPGPFGMAQTGIPFGETQAVAEWLQLNALVGQPEKVHPKRPITGFACPRAEVSGKRLWGLFQQIYVNADAFFAQNFVTNYCPLIWMKESAANITPDKINKEQMRVVNEACQKHLQANIRILQSKVLIGVGAYAKKQLELAAAAMPDRELQIYSILHPSPASPMANKCWPAKPLEQLAHIYQEAGLDLPPCL